MNLLDQQLDVNQLEERLDGLEVAPVVTRTLMSDDAARRALAEAALGAVAA